MRPRGLDEWAQQGLKQERSGDTWGRPAPGLFKRAPGDEGASVDNATSVCQVAGRAESPGTAH